MIGALAGIDGPDDLKKLSMKELAGVCAEIREYMTEHISQSGGHFASSLGVVELTVALHYVFDSPRDKIVWDVGHQCYPHKILTGRRDAFPAIRSFGGISGFPKMKENVHDHFGVGHASTSLSAGLGMALSRDIRGLDHHVVSIIGDGALTGGMALEALNHAGYLQRRLIIVLNDNKMSISENVGALSQYTSRITKTRLYRSVKETVDSIARTSDDKQGIERLRKSLKGAASPSFLFEKLGVSYMGPVDGHRMEDIISALKVAKRARGPVLVHLKTVKGKGVDYAEEDSTRFHGVGKFDKKNGNTVACAGCSYTDVFGETLVRMAGKDKRIVAITAAMCQGTGLSEFARLYPDRFFDVGIAEQHAVTMAAGLASQGMIPVVAIYSTFLQRAYDQMVHDVALQGLPVIFAIDRAGLVGEDGPTHHGAFDCSFLRSIPGLTIAAPKDKNELIQMLYLAKSIGGPVAIRYPRGGNSGENLHFEERGMEVPSSELLIPGKSCVIIAAGSMVGPALEAARAINSERKGCVAVINARFIKPIDPRIVGFLRRVGKGVVVEENSVLGGLGSGIAEMVCAERIKIRILGLPDRFIPHGKRDRLLAHSGLTSEDIEKAVRSLL